MEAIVNTNFMRAPLFKQGKVRDIYDFGDHYLIVSTDRISAFDVVMKQGIPGKGKVLNTMAEFWFDNTRDIVKNHLISTDVSAFPKECQDFQQQLEGRSMLVRKADPFPVECVVRGYLAGGGWKEYREKGSISGIPLPPGLKQADKLELPIFTPATKAELGEHDENISFETAIEKVGEEAAELVRELSLKLYLKGSAISETKGILLADTKFEFGKINGELMLIDEILTPDSSRFWPKEKYEPGHDQENLDKQFLRDYLEGLDWDKKPPPPDLPAEIIEQTAERYQYIAGVLLS